MITSCAEAKRHILMRPLPTLLHLPLLQTLNKGMP